MSDTYPFDPYDWYYFAADTSPSTNVWASARGAFVDPTADASYLAFVAAGGEAATLATAVEVYAEIARIAAAFTREYKQTQTVTGATTLTNPLAWYVELNNTTGANQIVKLPQANLPKSFPLGQPLIIKNVSASAASTVTLQQSDGDAIVPLAVTDFAVIITTSFASQDGQQTYFKSYTGNSSITSSGVAIFSAAGSSAKISQLGGTAGQLMLFQGASDPTAASLSGDATNNSTGVLTLGVTAITGKTADTSPDVAADLLLTYDNSANALKKVLPSDFLKAPGSIGGTTAGAGAFTTLSASGLISANGGQVAFPASQNASADANTLDDYEEGTWTPVLTFSTAGDLSVSYTTQVGTYSKVGRVVFAQFRIVTSAFTHTTAANSLQITGLPFTSISTTGSGNEGALSWQGITKAGYTNIVCQLSANASLLQFPAAASGSAISNVAAADMPTGGSVILNGSIVYFA